MNLSDLKNHPNTINVTLKSTGPNGIANAPTTANVSCPTVTPTTSSLNNETISVIGNAVQTGTATLQQGSGNEYAIRVSGSDATKNCYWLPWGSGKVFYGTLGAAHEYFFTYTLNGCGFIIGGTTAQPFVAHANLDSTRLTPIDTTGFNAERARLANIENTKIQAQIYMHFYGNLAAHFISNNTLTGNKVTVITPQEYLVDAGAAFGVIYVIRKGGNWEFFGNWAGKSKQIW